MKSCKNIMRVTQELGENDALLDKARQKVANVIWYFNNQEALDPRIGKTRS